MVYVKFSETSEFLISNVQEVISVEYEIVDDYTEKCRIEYIDTEGIECYEEELGIYSSPLFASNKLQKSVNKPVVTLYNKDAYSEMSNAMKREDPGTISTRTVSADWQTATRERTYYRKNRYEAYGSVTFKYDKNSAEITSYSWTYSSIGAWKFSKWDKFCDSTGILLIKANCGVDYKGNFTSDPFGFSEGTMRVWCSNDGKASWDGYTD